MRTSVQVRVIQNAPCEMQNEAIFGLHFEFCISHYRVALARLLDRLTTNRELPLNRAAWPDDSARKVFLDRAVLRSFTAEPLQHGEVALVAIVRQQLVPGWRGEWNRDRVGPRVGFGI